MCANACLGFYFFLSFTQTAAAELDERCFLSAQSMQSLKISEHFQLVKLLGEGTYGKVMLAVHKKRGWWPCSPPHLRCSSFLCVLNRIQLLLRPGAALTPLAPNGKVVLADILKAKGDSLSFHLIPSGTPMALKFFPRQSTSLTSFLREYNLSLSYCTHPSLTRALGIFFSTPSYYVFAQQAGLYGDLYSVIVSEVSLFIAGMAWSS